MIALLVIITGICIALALAAIFVPAQDPWIDGEGGFDLDEYRREFREASDPPYPTRGEPYNPQYVDEEAVGAVDAPL